MCKRATRCVCCAVCEVNFLPISNCRLHLHSLSSNCSVEDEWKNGPQITKIETWFFLLFRSFFSLVNWKTFNLTEPSGNFEDLLYIVHKCKGRTSSHTGSWSILASHIFSVQYAQNWANFIQPLCVHTRTRKQTESKIKFSTEKWMLHTVSLNVCLCERVCALCTAHMLIIVTLTITANMPQ